jgi:hypothetical protein
MPLNWRLVEDDMMLIVHKGCGKGDLGSLMGWFFCGQLTASLLVDPSLHAWIRWSAAHFAATWVDLRGQGHSSTNMHPGL